ncbi:MAG: hypothetical protein P1R58_11220 [bacterium]|nr:hypothetical protein [bacterium]
MNLANFKQCPACKKWISLNELLTSPEFRPEGITVDAEENRLCFYFFTHTVSSCNSTFAVPIEEFREVIAEPIPDKIAALTDDCSRHCTKISNLAQCQVECGLAPFRRFILNLKLAKEKKQERSNPSQAVVG